MHIRFAAPVLLTLLGAMALSGCVIAPPRQQVVYSTPMQQPSTVIYTEVAPPPPQVEVIGVAPAGFFWLSGFWLWEGGRHTWHPGHWEAHRPGYAWTPHQWVPSGHGWQFRGGHWDIRH